jgi:hypothetical protein
VPLYRPKTPGGEVFGNPAPGRSMGGLSGIGFCNFEIGSCTKSLTAISDAPGFFVPGLCKVEINGEGKV